MSSPWPSRVLVLAPQVWSQDGGIQRYGRSLLKGLAVIRPQARVQVLTLLDRPHPFPWVALVFAALASAASRPQLVICTHLHLAPLSWLLARLNGARFWLACHGIEVWGQLAGLRRRAWEQADLLRLIERRNLSAASGLHFTTDDERDQSASLGFHTPTWVIQLGLLQRLSS